METSTRKLNSDTCIDSFRIFCCNWRNWTGNKRNCVCHSDSFEDRITHRNPHLNQSHQLFGNHGQQNIEEHLFFHQLRNPTKERI
ncbi:hypothetical protein Mapa_002780 [Marchantia paleacea]|nr:hypothetical protein Mapa_002780 [Marchantia paleacea]